jgi:hypothetical protein
MHEFPQALPLEQILQHVIFVSRDIRCVQRAENSEWLFGDGLKLRLPADDVDEARAKAKINLYIRPPRRTDRKSEIRSEIIYYVYQIESKRIG